MLVNNAQIRPNDAHFDKVGEIKGCFNGASQCISSRSKNAKS